MQSHTTIHARSLYNAPVHMAQIMTSIMPRTLVSKNGVVPQYKETYTKIVNEQHNMSEWVNIHSQHVLQKQNKKRDKILSHSPVFDRMQDLVSFTCVWQDAGSRLTCVWQNAGSCLAHLHLSDRMQDLTSFTCLTGCRILSHSPIWHNAGSCPALLCVSDIAGTSLAHLSLSHRMQSHSPEFDRMHDSVLPWPHSPVPVHQNAG